MSYFQLKRRITGQTEWRPAGRIHLQARHCLNDYYRNLYLDGEQGESAHYTIKAYEDYESARRNIEGIKLEIEQGEGVE